MPVQFVAVNWRQPAGNADESELFGYRARCFTGAQRSGRRGKILQADGGTLFLDEIADMPLELQARLLRVLDERQVTPLGTEETYASTSSSSAPATSSCRRWCVKPLPRRPVLRLAGIELQLPPLRDRSDKRELIRAVLALRWAATPCSARSDRLLMDCLWPGNIRQLRHVLRSAAALADGKRSRATTAVAHRAVRASPQRRHDRRRPDAGDDKPLPLKLNPIQANERAVLVQMLEQHRWNVSNVAKALDVSRNTLYRKLHSPHRGLTLNEARDPADADTRRCARRRLARALLVHHRLGPWLDECSAGRTPAAVDLLLSLPRRSAGDLQAPHRSAEAALRVFRDKTAAACRRHAL